MYSIVQKSPNMNSTTGNGSIESSSCFSLTASKIGQIISLSLTLAVSLVGNSLIVIIVCKTPTLRKSINYFIANMAVSDLLLPVFWLPWRLSELHYDNSWSIGGQFRQALCKIVPFFSYVSIAVSVQNLILIAVDRFGAVVFPLRSPLIRSKLRPFFILATWIVAVAFSSSYLFVFDLFKYQGETGCIERWKKAFGESSSFTDFIVAFFIVFIYLPVLLLAILYSIILINLKTQVHPGEQFANTQQQQNKRNRNVLQLSITIVTVFVLCWLPYTTNFFIIQTGSIHFSCGFRLYFDVTLCMTSSYCAINPLICFIFSSNYRQGLKRLINGSTVVET